MAKGNGGTARRRRVSTADIRARKGGDSPIVCLTAYTAPAARLMQDHVDLLLVGDSVGMVVYGLDTTVAVTLDMMIAHGAAVVRGADRPCVVVDLPFGSYQESPAAAFRAAARVMAETGCSAVKLEGGREMAETVRFLVERGVPVMGHVGLTPQHVHRFGGFRPQGRTDAETEALCADAAAVVEAGAFAVVVEAVPENAARRVTDGGADRRHRRRPRRRRSDPGHRRHHGHVRGVHAALRQTLRRSRRRLRRRRPPLRRRGARRRLPRPRTHVQTEDIGKPKA